MNTNYIVIHYHFDSYNRQGDPTYSVCGATWMKRRRRPPFTTLDVDAITCKKCLRAAGIDYAREANAQRRAAIVAAAAAAAVSSK